MAKDKKSFVLYCDFGNIFEQLTDKQAGQLAKHIFRYVNDLNPTVENKLIGVAFEPIKLQLKRDLVKYETTRKKNSDNAKKRWGKNAKSSGRINGIIKTTKNADNDTVTDTDTDKKTASTTPAHDLKGSNLYRKPIIPTKQQVWEAIKSCGGTKEMAKSFWEKYEGTGWYLGNSPVVSYSALASKFVSTWKSKEFKEETGASAPLHTIPA